MATAAAQEDSPEALAHALQTLQGLQPLTSYPIEPCIPGDMPSRIQRYSRLTRRQIAELSALREVDELYERLSGREGLAVARPAGTVTQAEIGALYGYIAMNETSVVHADAIDVLKSLMEVCVCVCVYVHVCVSVAWLSLITGILSVWLPMCVCLNACRLSIVRVRVVMSGK